MNQRIVERTDRVYLDSSVDRCDPSFHCPMRSHCARYVAALPPINASMQDFSLHPKWSSAYCPAYVSAQDCLRKVKEPKKPAMKRRYYDSEW